MSANDLLKTDIIAYLHQHENKDLLRFITCGSVDDGKSTLIGRLLHDTKMIYEDQLAAISNDSKTHGTVGNEVDLALLVDGLQSEREQGITIDVAYRYFSTDKRKFIIADTPGHEQYTRNMATGASTANLAILLIDARYGVQTQTRRHSFICSLLGIRHFIIAINKMDLVDYDQGCYLNIQSDYLAFAEGLGIPDIHFVPVSALAGDNITELSEKTPWYKGQPLLTLLEEVSLEQDVNINDLRLPVQHVNRPDLNFRGFSGTLASGKIQAGDKIKSLPSGQKSSVKQVLISGQEAQTAWPGDAITVTLTDEIDISRGDMIVSEKAELAPTQQLEIDLVWMHDTPLTCHKQYLIKIGPREVFGSVEEILYEVNVNDQSKHKVDQLPLNAIGRCRLSLTEPVVAEAYKTNPRIGNLIFIDRLTNITVGAAMVNQSSLSDSDTQAHATRLTGTQRAGQFYQKPALIRIQGPVEHREAFAIQLENQLTYAGHLAWVVDTKPLTSMEKDLPKDHKALLQQAHTQSLLAAGFIVITFDPSLDALLTKSIEKASVELVMECSLEAKTGSKEISAAIATLKEQGILLKS